MLMRSAFVLGTILLVASCVVLSAGQSVPAQVDRSEEVIKAGLYILKNTRTVAAAAKVKCGERVGCGNCTESDSCVWCDSSNKCLNGSWYGPDGEIIKGCNDWRWKQCKVNGKAVFWSSVAIVGLFFVLGLTCCLCCIYCCCCRRRSYQRFYDVEDLRTKEREERRREGEARRNAMYEKYGTPEERAKVQLDEYNRKSFKEPNQSYTYKKNSLFSNN